MARVLSLMMMSKSVDARDKPRRFPSPWTVEDTASCFVVRDNEGQALAHVYYEGEPGRPSAAKLLTKTRRGASRSTLRSCLTSCLEARRHCSCVHCGADRQHHQLRCASARLMASFDVPNLIVAMYVSGGEYVAWGVKWRFIQRPLNGLLLLKKRFATSFLSNSNPSRATCHSAKPRTH